MQSTAESKHFQGQIRVTRSINDAVFQIKGDIRRAVMVNHLERLEINPRSFQQ